MTLFVLLAAGLTGLALGFVLWPLRSRGKVESTDVRQHQNVHIYQQRRAELRLEQQQGRLTDADLEQLNDELAGSLLDDVPEAPETSAPHEPIAPRGLRWVPVCLAGLLPVSAVWLYLLLGAGSEFELAEAADLLRSPVERPAALAELVVRLERRVADQPEDVDSFFLLGHARMRERNFSAAADSFAKVLALRGADPNTQVSLIQARFMADGGRISQTNRVQAEALLEQVPNQPLVLEMLAVDAVAAANYTDAAAYLQRALTGGVSAARAGALRSELERVRQLAGLGPGPGIDVVVHGLSSLSDLPPEAVLYVIARTEGIRLPRMVARTGVDRDPLTVRLDQTTVMGEQAPLGEGEQLQVIVRLSLDGDVVAGPGSREVISSPVTLGLQPVSVQLDLAAPGSNASPPVIAERPPVAGEPGPSSAVSGAVVTVHLSAEPGVLAPPGTRVFLIARPVSGPPMPIAVRALSFGDLPIVVRLSDEDAMTPGRTFASFDKVKVLARLSRSGSPIKQAGDNETEVLEVTPGDQPDVSLQLR